MELFGLIGFVVIALAAILVGCELFTNGIEWIGVRHNLSRGTVGSVLAAVGTALPETMVPIVAVLVIGGEFSEEIGIGAPLMIATLAFALAAMAAIVFHRQGRRGLHLDINTGDLQYNLRFFLLVYAVVVGVSFVGAAWVKYLAAAFILGAYVWYVRRRLADESDDDEELRPLHLQRGTEAPRLRFIYLQSAVGLVIIFFAAHLFVTNLENLAIVLGELLGWQPAVTALIMALVLSPVATELPENFNSLLWIRRGEDTLAIGNLSGAMIFQSCIPAAFGILFTSWVLDPRALASAVAVFLAVAAILLAVRGRDKPAPYLLLAGLPLYAGWLIYALMH